MLNVKCTKSFQNVYTVHYMTYYFDRLSFNDLPKRVYIAHLSTFKKILFFFKIGMSVTVNRFHSHSNDFYEIIIHRNILLHYKVFINVNICINKVTTVPGR